MGDERKSFNKESKSKDSNLGDFGLVIKSLSNFVLGLIGLTAILLLAIFFIKGGIWLAPLVLPWLSKIMWIVIALNLFILSPLSFFRRTRGFSAIGLWISSYIYGLTLWFWGLLVVYLLWGMFGVFIGLIFAGVGVVPIAIIGSALKGQWSITGQLILLVFFTFVSRILSHYMINQYEENVMEEEGENDYKKDETISQSPINLLELSQGFLGKTFGALILHHNQRIESYNLRTKQNMLKQIINEINGTMMMLPPTLNTPLNKTRIMTLIDMWNSKAYNKDFWNSDSSKVLQEILDSGKIVLEETGLPIDDDNLFTIFQIIVLNFVYSGIKDPRMILFISDCIRSQNEIE